MSGAGSRVVLATRNAKKLAELRRMLEPAAAGVEVLGLDDVAACVEPAETEPTFAGNALLKARAAVRATGLPALADDSGLCVDALNGMPGVLSARWAGRGKDDDANNALLLEQVADVPDERRGAQFRCAMALVRPVPQAGMAGSGGNVGASAGEDVEPVEAGTAEVVTAGVLRGRLLREPRGREGFGYDPLFVADGERLSNAELHAGRKDAISHRGQALRAVLPALLAAIHPS